MKSFKNNKKKFYSIGILFTILITVVYFNSARFTYSTNACYDIKVNINDKNLSPYYDFNKELIKNKLKYKKMNTKVLNKFKLRKTLSSRELDLVETKFPWKLEKIINNELVLRSLAKLDFMIKIPNENIEMRETTCVPQVKEEKFLGYLNKCFKLNDPVTEKTSYLKVIQEEDIFFQVTGIYDSHISDQIKRNLSSSVLFNLYFPNDTYPEKRSLIYLNKFAKEITCPELISPKFKVGDCVENQGIVKNINKKSGVYELYYSGGDLGKREPSSKNKSDLFKSRLENGIKDIFFYDQKLFSKGYNCDK